MVVLKGACAPGRPGTGRGGRRSGCSWRWSSGRWSRSSRGAGCGLPLCCSSKALRSHRWLGSYGGGLVAGVGATCTATSGDAEGRVVCHRGGREHGHGSRDQRMGPTGTRRAPVITGMRPRMGCATGGGGSGGSTSNKLPNGLRRASAGLRELFSAGSVRGKSVIQVCTILTEKMGSFK